MLKHVKSWAPCQAHHENLGMGFSHSQSSERALGEGVILALISLYPGETEIRGGERWGHTHPQHATSWALPAFGP